MHCAGFNERFEIAEKPNHRGAYEVYDFVNYKHVGILFDRISEAVKWLESKGFTRTDFKEF